MSGLTASIAKIAIVVGLVVTIAYYLKLDPIVTKVALGVGIFAALVITIINLVRRLKGRGKKVDPAKQARRDAKKRLREEEKVLRVRFRELVKHLRQEQGGLGIRYSHGRDRHAWWVVLGPQGHGKSTLLQAATGSQEIAGADADAVRFFVTPTAVFIEFPADYDRRPETALALPSFLRELRRLRRQPIDGVLLVQRVDELLVDDVDPAALVASARRQIDLLAKTLEVQVPVVLAGSQLDALPGLGELCADAEHVDPSRAMGIALPARLTGQATAETASAHFVARGGPIAWVRDRCFTLVASSADGYVSQARLFGFWQSFGELGERAANLGGLLSAARLPGGDPLSLRGIYFTAAGSGGHGSAADPCLTRMAREVGGELAGGGLGAPPRVFTLDFLGHELHRAGGYGRRSRPYRRRRMITQGVVAGLALCVGGYAAVDMTTSANGTIDLLQSTSDLAHAVPQEGVRLPIEGELRPYESQMKNAAIWRAESPEEDLGWGFFRADLVKGAATAAVRASMCRSIVAPALKVAQEELNEFVAAFAEGGVPGADRRKAALRQLRLFLMLTEGGAEPEACKPRDSRFWREEVARVAIVETIAAKDARLQALLESYAEIVGEDQGAQERSGAELDACVRSLGAQAAGRGDDQVRLVEQVRGILTREAGEHALVDDLVNEINIGEDSIPLHRITSSGRVSPRRRQKIEHALTKDGWSEFSRRLSDLLRDPSSGGGWALCRGDEGGAEERCELAMEIYASRYEEAWRGFIADIAIQQPNTIPQAIAVYNDLVSEKPLEKIWTEIGRNTQGLSPVACMLPRAPGSRDSANEVLAMLRGDSPAGSESATLKHAKRMAQTFQGFVRFGAPTEGQDASSATPLGKYHERLMELRDAARQAYESREQVGALVEVMEASLKDLRASLQNEPLGEWNMGVESLLKPPLDSLEVVIRGIGRDTLNKQWCEEIIRPLRRRVAGYYPFNKQSMLPAEAADVSDFFHPVTGEIARFREGHLRSYVHVDSLGHDIVIADSDLDAKLHINPSVVELLNASNHLGLLLYPGGEKAEISFELTMGCTPQMAKVELSVGEEIISYRCGAEQAKGVSWPGEPAAKSVMLNVISNVEKQDKHHKKGDFALIELMERKLSPSRDLKAGTIKLNLDARKNDLGILRMTVRPHKIQGGNIFYGFGKSKIFLAPFRSKQFMEPPASLFVETAGYSCSQ